MKDHCDWMLKPLVFNQIQQVMGAVQIDLPDKTATNILPGPEALGTDAFNQDWSQRRRFANPLWCLITRCLSQIKNQVARSPNCGLPHTGSLVPNNPRDGGRLPPASSSLGGSGDTSIRAHSD